MKSHPKTSLTANLIKEAHQIRAKIRAGEITGQTSSYVPGLVQTNLAIVPQKYADDFMYFCYLNHRACPLLAVSLPGDPSLPKLGEDIDVRSDLPCYRVFVNGKQKEEPHDISHLWQDDFVAFASGCSFSFETALIDAGIDIRHVDENKNVSMYNTNIHCKRSGVFAGNMVVSMRPFTPANAIRAIQISTRFPDVHGAPIHFGDPAAIGIKDINLPDYGDPIEIKAGEVPVFWPCGVTPQLAIENAKLPLCITHKAGHMLITDVLNYELAVF